MILKRTPRFNRQTKKMLSGDKDVLREVIRAILKNPKAGEQKSGDLADVWVVKCKVSNQEHRLAYAFDEEELVLLAFGPRENFYRDLKRSL